MNINKSFINKSKFNKKISFTILIMLLLKELYQKYLQCK